MMQFENCCCNMVELGAFFLLLNLPYPRFIFVHRSSEVKIAEREDVNSQWSSTKETSVEGKDLKVMLQLTEHIPTSDPRITLDPCSLFSCSLTSRFLKLPNTCFVSGQLACEPCFM